MINVQLNNKYTHKKMYSLQDELKDSYATNPRFEKDLISMHASLQDRKMHVNLFLRLIYIWK